MGTYPVAVKRLSKTMPAGDEFPPPGSRREVVFAGRCKHSQPSVGDFGCRAAKMRLALCALSCRN